MSKVPSRNMPEDQITQLISGPLSAFYTNNPFIGSKLSDLRQNGLGKLIDQVYSQFGTQGLQAISQYASQASGDALANSRSAANQDPNVNKVLVSDAVSYKAPSAITDTSSLGATGSSAGSGSNSNYVTLNGHTYNLDNPAEADAYYAAQRDEYISNAESTSRSALADAAATYGSNLGTLNSDLTTLDNNQETYGRGAARSITDLGQGYDLGTVNRGQTFARLAPRAYESSQGSSQQFAQDKLHQGIGDVTSALEDANKNFGQQRQDLTAERTALETGYNGYTAGQGTYLDQARQKAGDFYNTQGANAFDLTSPAAFNYSRNSFTPYQAKQVDLSSVTPYTTFSQLPNSSAPSGGTTPPAGNYQSGSGAAGLEQYLGYTPSESERSMLDKYLRLGYT